MLHDNFYSILRRQGPEEEMTTSGVLARKYFFRLSTNKSHQVYSGHFPGNPVTPGVFQVRILHELTEEIAGKPLRMMHADNIKYLSLMIPSLHSELDCKITIKENITGTLAVSADLTSGEITFIKFKGTFEADGI